MDERAVPYVDEDTPEQQERCRALEMMVLLTALLDATWRSGRTVALEDMTLSQRWRERLAITRRKAARAWFLERSAAHRRHVEDIATCAGLADGRIWELVQRFVVDGEDPAPLTALYDAVADRPGRKKFGLDVAFVP